MYDSKGNRTEEAYFDADDKPIMLSDGCARITYSYDAFNNEVETCCYDVSGVQLRCE